jgi:hypothetical protein
MESISGWIDDMDRTEVETHVSIPLEMLVDEPGGSDNSDDGKYSRYNPSYIMRCDGNQEENEDSCDKKKCLIK